MPTFTGDDVRRLARLARLDLDDAEVALFARQLAEILEFAREVQAVDTSSAPIMPVDHGSAPLREDIVRPSLPHDEVVAGSPSVDPASGLFTVPRVLGGS